MKNQVQVKVNLHVLLETDMNMEELLLKFAEENIIGGKLKLVIGDGSSHVMDVCEASDGEILSFLINGEEIVENQKVTKPENLVTKFTEVK